MLLVDGSSYMFRAFHALPPLVNSKGEPTGAVYGISAMLRKLIAEQRQTGGAPMMAVVFDAKGKTFRDDMYAQYKANRPPTPPDLAGQIEYIHELVDALGVPMLVVPGVEADDVIGTLAERAREAGMRVTLSSNDKDFAQLVNDSVTLINTMDDGVLDAKGVQAKFGVGPERIVDYLALVGDTVDNVPGVPKVGPKTAAKWLNEFESVDGVIANADNIKGKIGDNLRASLDQLPLSRALVTIKRDVDLDVGPQDLALRPPDNDRLRELYGKLEFKTWLSELLEGGAASQEAPAGKQPAEAAAASNVVTEHEIVLDEAAFERWLERLGAAEHFAFDTETTSLDYMQAEIVGVSFAVESGHAAYVPVAHSYAGAPEQLARDRVLGALKPLLEDPQRVKVGQNLKYDMSVLARYDIELAGVEFDTMLESYVLDSPASRHDMDSLALKYLSHRTIHFEDVAGKGAKQLTFDQVAVEEAGPYAAEDADVTLRLHEVLWPRLAAEPSLEKLYREIEAPLVPVLSRIERRGVRVDAKALQRQSKELAERMAELEQDAYDAAGHPFNLGSTKQIQAILYDELGLPVKAKTPKGAPSTAEAVLQELALDYPLPKIILEYRGLSKLKSTYTDTLPTCINASTGRVHTSYHQAVASTGRLSSSDPNLQNIPIRTAEGRRIRQAFVPADGSVLLACDYSQIELRIMAHLSQDEGLLGAFAAGEDIHRSTAAEVFGKTRDEVDADQRRSAKAINFGLIYGMSAFGLARQLGIGRGEAQAYVDRYFERYPGVKRYMDETRTGASSKGYVETVFGRRLYLPEINARNQQRRQYAERTAINAPMQGTAADIIKRAMLRVEDHLATAGINANMIMQVHDELVFEVAAGDVQAARATIEGVMSGAAELAVPLVVDSGVGQNWDEAH
ncbi:MAG: DNA polymerase I [Gammaproteobacteria bacterium]